MMVLEHGTDQSERELREVTRLIPEPVPGRARYPGTEHRDGAFHKGVSRERKVCPVPQKPLLLPAEMPNFWTLSQGNIYRTSFTELTNTLSTSRKPRSFSAQLLTPSVKQEVPQQQGREGRTVQIHRCSTLPHCCLSN